MHGMGHKEKEDEVCTGVMARALLCDTTEEGWKRRAVFGRHDVHNDDWVGRREPTPLSRGMNKLRLLCWPGFSEFILMVS